MYRFTYDEKRNRIYILIEGSLTEQEIENYKSELIDTINKTRSGFTVFADSSKSSIEFLENSWKLQAARDHGKAMGFLEVATVLSIEAYEIHKISPFKGIKNTFTDAKEAERFLDSLTQ